VDAALFEAIHAQLEETKRRARIPEKGARYLLPGRWVWAEGGRTNEARNAY
jgi:site-specific DNA recombinase